MSVGGYVKTHNHIIVRWSNHDGDAGGSHKASVRKFQVNRWAAYLVAIPLMLVAGVAAVFFVSAFLALFVLAGGAFGIWVWWMRRKLHQSAQPRQSEVLEGEYVVVQEVHGTHTETDRAENR